MSGAHRIGAVPYLNARPLVEGLAARPDVDYVEEVPSALARRLRRAELDVALVSSVEVLHEDGRPHVEGLCIASAGPVLSVKVVSGGDPRRARTVALDGASLTAATLARVVYRVFFRRADVEFTRAPVKPDPRATGADATLLIGDAALVLPDDPEHQIDLGAAWSEATGLPFVWALWVLAKPGAPADLTSILHDALRAGLGRTDAYARAAASATRGAPPAERLAPERARRYLDDVMRYRLETEEREGLRRFGALAADAGGFVAP